MPTDDVAYNHLYLLFMYSTGCLLSLLPGVEEDFTAWWGEVKARLFPMLCGTTPLKGLSTGVSSDQNVVAEKSTEEVCI